MLRFQRVGSGSRTKNSPRGLELCTEQATRGKTLACDRPGVYIPVGWKVKPAIPDQSVDSLVRG